jgi:hypothetical protein
LTEFEVWVVSGPIAPDGPEPDYASVVVNTNWGVCVDATGYPSGATVTVPTPLADALTVWGSATPAPMSTPPKGRRK